MAEVKVKCVQLLCWVVSDTRKALRWSFTKSSTLLNLNLTCTTRAVMLTRPELASVSASETYQQLVRFALRDPVIPFVTFCGCSGKIWNVSSTLCLRKKRANFETV